LIPVLLYTHGFLMVSIVRAVLAAKVGAGTNQPGG
jgi:hypothetical protein